MASWSLLLLALELLATPGLAFTHLTPEHHDLVMADLHDGEQFCQSLAQEGLQGDLLITREGMSINCWSCTKIIQKLEKMVGKQPDKDSIAQAASRVCSKMRLLTGLCKKIMKTFLRRISKDIMAGKTPSEICVDIKMCKP
ncbi:granulysin isoform X1 [Pteropus medius]|uniref:Granulysin n=1 Tax=Pteropus vampyrus TaxID=132908 RepID=A0A6P3QSB2_PTEVA|nr:granulysin [Pteropus vampyrus]XP_039708340.1 granulysin isoform X1 [Pteropus giganteus]